MVSVGALQKLGGGRCLHENLGPICGCRCAHLRRKKGEYRSRAERADSKSRKPASMRDRCCIASIAGSEARLQSGAPKRVQVLFPLRNDTLALFLTAEAEHRR